MPAMEFELRHFDPAEVDLVVPEIMEFTGEDEDFIRQRIGKVALLRHANNANLVDKVDPNEVFTYRFWPKAERLAAEELRRQRQAASDERFETIFQETYKRLLNTLVPGGDPQTPNEGLGQTMLTMSVDNFETAEEYEEWWTTSRPEFDGKIPLEIFQTDSEEAQREVLGHIMLNSTKRRRAREAWDEDEPLLDVQGPKKDKEEDKPD